MNGNLFEVLVDRNIINENTEIEATLRARDLSGVSWLTFTGTFFYLAHSLNDDGSGNVIVEDTRDGSSATLRMQDITTIDGMEPRRLAGIYALGEDGLPIKQGARRGRKPKNRVAV
jgi:hypothetical protein